MQFTLQDIQPESDFRLLNLAKLFIGPVSLKIGRPEVSSKGQKHDLIRGLAESKLNTIADRISTVLTDDKITEEEFRLILSKVDKYNQMKAEIRGHQKQSGGLSEHEKKQVVSACERRCDDDSPRQVIRIDSSWNQQWHLSISCWRA